MTLLRFALYRVAVFGSVCIIILSLMTLTGHAINLASAFLYVWHTVQQTLIAAAG